MPKDFGNLGSTDFGNLGMSDTKKWDHQNPCDEFLEMKKNPDLDDEKGISQSRYNFLANVIRDGPKHERWKAWDEFVPNWKERGDPNSEEKLQAKDGIDFYEQLQEAGLSKVTIINKIMPALAHFLDECINRNIIDANPAAYVVHKIDSPDPDKNYPEITVGELGNFFRSIDDPLHRALYVYMAKLAVRSGEALNTDLPFLHLNHPIYYDYLDSVGIELHDEVEDYPDSVYIPPEPERKEEFRGEVRNEGNKTKEGKRLPVDRELKRVLLDWIAVRPKTGYPHPLFYSPFREGTRPRRSSMLRRLKEYLIDYGLAEEYVKSDDKNMDQHYFRHFFSTNMQIGEGTYNEGDWSWAEVQVIRGDIGGGPGDDSELRDTYTQDWGDLIREPYLEDIYNFGIYKSAIQAVGEGWEQ